MSSIQWPNAGAGGIQIYSSTAAFPLTGNTLGAQAIDSSNIGNLYEWSGTSWILTASSSSTNGITALTGDGTATGPGSVALTLATVNSNVGAFALPTITVNAKGLVTAASAASTTGTGSVVLANTPTLITPVLGAATATSLVASGAISGSNLTSGGHASADIANSLLTTTGDIIYASSASTPARLAIGSTGNLLGISGGIPAWTATANLTEATSAVLTIVGGTGSVIGSGTSIQVKQASGSQAGYLSSTDWTTFNNKGSGSVTAVSVVSSNGFAGSSSGGTAPALTLSTSITGILKGNATAISAATTNSHAVMVGAGAADFTNVGPGASTGIPLVSNGIGSDPSFSTAAVAGGGTGVTAVTTAPTATAFAGWDANSNLSANNFITGFATTATAAGTTTLTVASAEQQIFTGSTTQTVKLPTTSIVAGVSYTIINNSIGVVTVQSSGANTIQAMASGTQLIVTALVATPTTAANWQAIYIPQSQVLAGISPTIQKFTSGSGTYTTPSGVQYIKVVLTGAGGSGGAGTSSGNYVSGCGGAAGGTAILYITSPSATYSYSVGSGGAGVSSSGSGGNAGGNTTFSTATANGGSGGNAGQGSAVSSGGTASGGNTNITGGAGSAGTTGVGTIPIGGAGGTGGGSVWGSGGAGGSSGGGTIGAGQAYGAGGGGAPGQNSLQTSGAGAGGYIEVTEYYNNLAIGTTAAVTANYVIAGPTSGSASSPTFRALVTADLPAGICAIYSQPSGTISSSYNTVTYGNSIRDTNSAYSSGVFTAPAVGLYLVTANAFLNGTQTINQEAVYMQVTHNGSSYFQVVTATSLAGVNQGPGISLSTVVYCSATSDTISIQLGTGLTGTLSYGTVNQSVLSIVKIG